MISAWAPKATEAVKVQRQLDNLLEQKMVSRSAHLPNIGLELFLYA